MTNDIWGNPLSHSSPEVARRFETAVRLMNAYQADPLAEIDGLLAEHSDFVMGHVFRAAALALTADKTFELEMARSLAGAEALASQANDRERGHIAAVRAWHDGDIARATEAWGRVAIDYPRDITAIQFAQLGDFFLGYSAMLRDRVARAVTHWSPSMPHYGFLLGMYAFGLEETAEYERAEQCGREAVSLDRQDAWAAHAVAHVMEMQGRTAEGSAWLQKTAEGWSPNGLFAFHNWWHLALFAIEAGDVPGALRLFDEKISAGGFGQALELIDGSALLWRLSVLGHDVGDRWTMLAEKWLTRADDRYYVFNDMHAMMSFVGAGWREAQTDLLHALEASVAQRGTNGMMTREVGLQATQAIVAFGAGDYAKAADLLLAVQGKANRFGGSHAQRDVFSWTLTEAAIRGGDRALAAALVAERLARKPQSALNKAWAGRAAKMVKRAAA
jgi:tetratricopeptide (TPR) repeat protein